MIAKMQKTDFLLFDQGFLSFWKNFFAHLHLSSYIHDAILSTWTPSMSGASLDNLFWKSLCGRCLYTELDIKTKFLKCTARYARCNVVGGVACTSWEAIASQRY